MRYLDNRLLTLTGREWMLVEQHEKGERLLRLLLGDSEALRDLQCDFALWILARSNAANFASVRSRVLTSVRHGRSVSCEMRNMVNVSAREAKQRADELQPVYVNMPTYAEREAALRDA